jgi:hypothetical protein
MFDEQDPNMIDPPDNSGGTGKASTAGMDSPEDEAAAAIDPPDNSGGGTKSSS